MKSKTELDSELVLRYVVRTVSDDGLLKCAKDRLGDAILIYPYDTMEEAMNAIDRCNDWGEYLIIPLVSRSHIWPE